MEDGPFTVAGGRWRMDHLQWQGGDGRCTIYSGMGEMEDESSSGSEEMEDGPFTVEGRRWRLNQTVAVVGD